MRLITHGWMYMTSPVSIMMTKMKANTGLNKLWSSRALPVVSSPNFIIVPVTIMTTPKMTIRDTHKRWNLRLNVASFRKPINSYAH